MIANYEGREILLYWRFARFFVPYLVNILRVHEKIEEYVDR